MYGHRTHSPIGRSRFGVYPLVVLGRTGHRPVHGREKGTGVGNITMAKAVGRSRASDLHSPQADTVGRVDVLAARLLKILVDRSSDPYVKALYSQYQRVVDATIKDTLGGFNCAKALRQLGLVQPSEVQPKQARQARQPKQDRRPKPVRPKQSGLGVVGVEFIDGPGRPGRPGAGPWTPGGTAA